MQQIALQTKNTYSKKAKISVSVVNCNGVLQHFAIAWDRATLHKNFEKWIFLFSDVKDGCESNGGGLAILRLHFEKLFSIATSCNILQHLQQF